MQRDALLAGSAVLVLTVAAAVAAVVPGVLASPRADREPPGRIDVTETMIAAGPVTGSTATLVVDTRLTHYGGPSENVTLELRAVDAETGLVETTERRALDAVTGDRNELSVVTNLTVEREGNYRLETIVYQDDRRVASGEKAIRGVGSLTPDYAETDVGFHRFEGGVPGSLPVVTYSIVDVSDNRTTLNASAYLTNTGDVPAGNLELRIRARQLDSNIIADSETARVGRLRPGRTATPSVELTVPDDYNYYLDAILVKDGVIVGTATAPAKLDPTETIPTNRTRRDVGLRTGDFERGNAAGEPTPRPEPEATPTAGESGPGFGLAGAVVALVAGLVLVARRHS